MIKKKKGPDAVKQPDPKRMTEIKRLLKSKQKELESQEAQLFLKFAESYPPANLKIDAALAVWNFLIFLKDNDYVIVDAKEWARLRVEVGEPT